jgi:hypothetical protein
MHAAVQVDRAVPPGSAIQDGHVSGICPVARSGQNPVRCRL